MGLSLLDNVIIPQRFGCLLYLRKTHEYLPYDHLTSQVLRESARDSIFALPIVLRQRLSDRQIEAFHQLGRQHGFFDRKGRFIGRAIDRAPPEDKLLGPLTLHLSVTQSCDLRCRHCFAAPEMESANGELLTQRELEDLFDECADIGCMRVALTGGEPLNRPDLFEIIDLITARGIDVCLTTNGMRIDRRIADELARRPFAWVNVSLDGATPETNDRVRGRGTFERVVANLKRHFKWRMRFGLSITLHPLNIDEIPLFPGLARKLGAETVMMRGCYPIGRASESGDLHLSFDRYREALSEIATSRLPVRVVPTSCEDGDLDDLAVVYENFGCAAGNMVATVLHDGGVSPCSLLGSGVPMDSIRRLGFTEIWNGGRGFEQIRKLAAPKSCRECDAYLACSGGCRARAWAAYQDLEAPDPWCKAG
jgi:radical SAM protein with 4Fe4S-binding SPASM domain